MAPQGAAGTAHAHELTVCWVDLGTVGPLSWWWGPTGCTFRAGASPYLLALPGLALLCDLSTRTSDRGLRLLDPEAPARQNKRGPYSADVQQSLGPQRCQ